MSLKTNQTIISFLIVHRSACYNHLSQVIYVCEWMENRMLLYKSINQRTTGLPGQHVCYKMFKNHGIYYNSDISISRKVTD